MKLKYSVLILAPLALVIATLPACGKKDSPSSGSNVMQDVSEVSLTADGWTTCYSGTYDENGDALADILTTCDGANLLLACRPVGDPNFTLAAYAPRADVTFDTGINTDVVHNARDVSWYYNADRSWGFAPTGAGGVYKNSCDYNGDGPQKKADQRLCWHAGGGNINNGYRCGTAGDDDPMTYSEWQRVVMHRN